ncbi:cytochrome B [Burkholderia ubonensis]|uniref:cytochrome b n=1 Tax=Burkholderia ubonensis TaxID=101571 RepID=UPI000756E5CA|nr:cytochrome b [Burkholderia ubonensis]KVD66293.1 cytochrome B [Burkholderia ubonensis]
MTPVSDHFSLPARLLHWSMAALILSMLFIGVGMVATVTQARNALLSVHRPLGIALLALVLIRLYVRFKHRAPALPGNIPDSQKLAAKLSHLVLYVLMVAMPLIGWAMLSAAGYPIMLYGPLHLPPITPVSVKLFALLRALHTWLAFALFLTVLMHIAAALLHGLVRRDGVFSSMARGARRFLPSP